MKGLYRRGVARLSLGQLDLAKADLEKALYFDPSNADIKRQLKAIKEKVTEATVATLIPAGSSSVAFVSRLTSSVARRARCHLLQELARRCLRVS